MVCLLVSSWDMNLFLIRGDRVVVREYDISARQAGTIGGLKALHGGRSAVRLVSGLIFEDTEVYEPRRILLPLSGNVHARARLVSLHPGNKLFNGSLDGYYAFGPDAVFGDGLNRHETSSIVTPSGIAFNC